MGEVKKSAAIAISVGDDTPGNTPDDLLDRERQGVDIRDLADLDTTGLFKKIRSNSSVHRFYGDKPISEDFFDDTTAPIVPGTLRKARLIKSIDLTNVHQKIIEESIEFNRVSVVGNFPTAAARIIQITVPKAAGGHFSPSRQGIDGKGFTWNIAFAPGDTFPGSPLPLFNPMGFPHSHIIFIYAQTPSQKLDYLNQTVNLFCDAINGTDKTALDLDDSQAFGYPLYFYLRQSGFGPPEGMPLGKAEFSQAQRTGIPGIKAVPSSTPGFVDIFATRPGIVGNSIKLQNFDSFAAAHAGAPYYARIVNLDTNFDQQAQEFSGVFLSNGLGSAGVNQILMSDTPRERKKRQKFLYDHIAEQRDLGQINLYEDGFPHYDIARPDYRVIMEKSISSIELPRYLVDHSSVSALDGVIDVFNTRKKIDRSSLETPYSSKGIRASVGQDQDTYRRSMIIQSGYDETSVSPAFFLDSTETIGLIDSPNSTTTAFDIVGIQSDYTPTIDPFSDVHRDTYKFYSSTNLDTDLKNALISPSGSMENYKSYDRMSNTGFVYENSATTVDSIVFGGLLK